MTEKTTYICDYCGAEFDEEDACEIHEKVERYNQIKNNVTFFDCDFEPFAPDDDAFCMEDIYGILIKNAEGREAVKKYYEYNGYDDPLHDWPESDIHYPLAIAFNDNDNWDDVEEKFDYWNRIRESFNKVAMEEVGHE